MDTKKKFNLAMFFLALTFYMMIDTTYHRALGDYILEFFGLNSWTGTFGTYSGFHLTILYFGILFFICLYFYRKYSDQVENITSLKKFIAFVLLVTLMAIMSTSSAKFIKSRSDGLKSIAYVSEDNELEYRSIDKELTTFSAYFTLENYSDVKQKFHVSIDSPWSRKENIPPIDIYNLEGEPANFSLEGKEEKTFQINLDDYVIKGGRKYENGGFKGDIDELMLHNAYEKIYLKEGKFFHLKIRE